MIDDEIMGLWYKLEPLIKADEYGEYLDSLNTVARYGNSKENPKLYEEILKEFELALVELQPDLKEEVPTYLRITISLGNKKRDFSDKDAKHIIDGGAFFPSSVIDYHIIQDR